jgi:predicted small lipoprotein YifL
MLQMRKNLRAVFHGFIIASTLLTMAGCGYKAPPYYETNKGG